MIVSTVTRDVLTPRAKARSHFIRLKVSPAAREDAWNLCGVVVQYGGVEVHDNCFEFPDEERWLIALEALRFRFGSEYFEAVDSGKNT